MFERDKEELRDMGIPLETGGNDAWFDDEVGYRVDRAAYALPEVAFTPDELAVLGLASRVWQQASLAAPGVPGACSSSRPPAWSPTSAAWSASSPGSAPASRPSSRSYAAVRDRRPIRFPYRTPGQPGVTERHLEPWGIVSRHGRWYVVGHDRDRGATRVFRLSRVAGPVRAAGRAGEVQVPEGIDLRAQVATLVPARAQPRGPAVRPPGLRASGSAPAGHRESRSGAGRLGRAHRALRRPRRAGRGGRRPRRRRPGDGPAGAAGTPSYAGCAACWASLPPPAARHDRGRPVSPGATDRLSRLLALVPYLVSRQGIPLAEAAAEFGITETQLVKDLELLFVCGTPGHLPDDLIEVDWDDGRVYLGNADTIARPLRLGVDEALALLVGLRALADVPGLHDRDALQRTLLKLEAAAGESALGQRPGAGRGRGPGPAGRRPAGAGRAAAGCT